MLEGGAKQHPRLVAEDVFRAVAVVHVEIHDGHPLESVNVDGVRRRHRDDPLASMELEEADYYWLTRAVLDATQTSASGRAVSLLEGGYHLPALAASATAHVRALLEKD